MIREGKGAKHRTPWLGNKLLQELREWMDHRPESDYLLARKNGTQVATSHLRRSVKRYAYKADIEEVGRVSPHTPRHTFAMQLYRDTG